MSKDANVGRLTKGQIEEWRGQICDPEIWTVQGIAELNQLCDLALQSLSQEAVRDEALSGIIDELAAIADACVDLQQNRKRPDSDPVMSWDNAPLTLGTLRKARALKREPNAAAQVITPSRDKWEKGEIVRTTEDELCYIRPCEVVGARTKEYEGYSGESYKELGIKIGALVYYIRDPREGYCVKAWKMKHGLPAQDW